MSEERVTLDLLGARVLTLSAEVRDLQQRFTGLEARLGALGSRFSGFEIAINGRLTALETRFGAQEERMNRLISLVVRIAERIEAPRE
ncbi:MAG: hypothetical protein ACREE4_08415 [Stellaceae bacterium]